MYFKHYKSLSPHISNIKSYIEVKLTYFKWHMYMARAVSTPCVFNGRFNKCERLYQHTIYFQIKQKPVSLHHVANENTNNKLRDTLEVLISLKSIDGSEHSIMKELNQQKCDIVTFKVTWVYLRMCLVVVYTGIVPEKFQYACSYTVMHMHACNTHITSSHNFSTHYDIVNQELKATHQNNFEDQSHQAMVNASQCSIVKVHQNDHTIPLCLGTKTIMSGTTSLTHSSLTSQKLLLTPRTVFAQWTCGHFQHLLVQPRRIK